MLSIRMTRLGKKKQPTYRVIVLDKRKDPWGNALEILGHYNPRTKVAELKTERIQYWISKGAQPSVTVHNLLVSQNIISGPMQRVKVKPKKKQEEAAAEAPKEAKDEAPKEEEAKPEAAEEPKPEETKEEKPKEEPQEEVKEEKEEPAA